MKNLQSETYEHHKAHGPNWLKWLAPIAGKPDVTGLELGTWKGEGARWFMEHIFTHPTSRFYAVDTFEGSTEHRMGGIDCSTNYDETIDRLAVFHGRAMIYKRQTHEAMKCFFRDDRFDFIYVDAAHDAMNVLRDAVLAFEILKVGGVMVFDDYEWRVMEQEVDCPKIAIDAFLACYARRLEVIGLGWQVAVRKLS